LPRRIINLSVAAVGLLLLSPLMLAIAALIKVMTKGPVFFTQTRVGLDSRAHSRPVTNGKRRHDLGGAPFTIYKFRTMRASDSMNGAELWASPDDPRVTPLGRILRNYRLDELPQLVNVLRGDMNVVGPRPEQPKIFAELRQCVDRYGERQQVRPGITGYAQISQQYDASIDDVRVKVGFDLEYIARHSALQDLKIMLKTLPVVVFKKGAW
jgi:lipopolysaccharide/colanic/teichoic acid biosynthesis glycosyltransferase